MNTTGGGSAGSNALYHLAKKGTKAVLLEKSKLTSGTTWHTGGIAWSLRPNEVEIELLRATQQTIAGLEEESGENPGWVNNGGLFIAHNNERLDEYKRLVTAGKAFGVEAHVLSPGEAQKLSPFLDKKAFSGAIFSPRDGVIDPAILTAALVRSAKAKGAMVSLRLRPGSIKLANTPGLS